MKAQSKKKPVAVNTTARGFCVIPADRPDIVKKVCTRLQKDGISFLMEDLDEIRWGKLRRADGTVTTSPYSDRSLGIAEMKTGPGTRITWPDPEAADGAQ